VSQRKKYQLKTADFPLSRSLTDQFITDLREALSLDASPEASYLDSVFLSKFTELGKDEAAVRRFRAIEKWLNTESTNHTTNERLISFGHRSDVTIVPEISVKRLLDRAASVIAQVLPWTPSLDIANGGFSGGSSTSKARVRGHPALKFLDKADITRPAFPLFCDVIRGTRWADHLRLPGLDPRYVEGNVLFTVPKNSEIDRVAAKEPDLNMFLQKSFGNQIRSCLKRVGINLNDQTANQELARIGSITGSLMTLDLSSASDSVTTELVRRLLPPDWFYYLDLVRSHKTDVDGVQHVNEMFSSMGNGFTFELESLIFYALTRATTSLRGIRGQISVYGDDIIAPSDVRLDLVSVLAFCGFSVNESKSFWTGPFRESCGKHWHAGLDISPFYLRGPFLVLSDLILTLNQLTSWASRCIGVVDPRYEVILRKYADQVPDSLWGGDDLTSRSSLVTGDAPRKELVFPQEIIPHDHVGGLLFWMFLALNRSEDGDHLSSDGSRPPRFARIKKRRTVDRNDLPVFLLGHEC
jgi:hypothetical protein